MITKSVLVCASILALVLAAATTLAGETIAKEKQVLRNVSSLAQSTKDDCETRIRRLDASSAEGQERLDEKNAVINLCDHQYNRDKTIERLVKKCAKYAEQPIVKQQSVAECQLSAFNYANALRTLKAEIGK